MHAVSTTRQRLPKHERHAQLLAVARELIRDSGTDEFTLARLAALAGVTKPLVYDHFGDRAGVFAELYRDFESGQRQRLADALLDVEPELSAVARIVATAYIDCCLAEGRELNSVVAALAGSPALSLVRHEAEGAYLAMCRDALEPFAGAIDTAGLQAVVGAGDALARAALAGRIGADRAGEALAVVVAAVATDAQTNTTTIGDES